MQKKSYRKCSLYSKEFLQVSRSCSECSLLYFSIHQPSQTKGLLSRDPSHKLDNSLRARPLGGQCGWMRLVTIRRIVRNVLGTQKSQGALPNSTLTSILRPAFPLCLTKIPYQLRKCSESRRSTKSGWWILDVCGLYKCAEH